MSTVLQVCTMLGSLGMFLYGMSLMSGGLQKMAGDKLRSFMAAMTSTALKRVFTGIVVTALVQSSTATTLMLVSFVNAGLLSLANAIGVVMGANIGTTVTAWIFALSFGGGSFSLGAIAVPLMFLGYLLIASKKKRNKNFGEFVMGFAFLFLGLSTLRETSTLLLDNDPVRVFLSHLTGFGVGSILIFMVTGACMTLMLQSSAATMAITMVLVANGYIPFEMAAAMVLGENIGTTITSNIAASVANVSAKRTARAHMLFNVFGVCWVFSIFHPFLRLIGVIVEAFGFPNPATTDFATADAATKEALVASLPFCVATLHSFFNIINTLVLIWFVPLIEKIVTWMVPSPKGETELFRLKYIGGGPLSTSELSLNEAKQEVVHFGEICYKGFGYVRQAINEPDPEKFEALNDKLIKYEEITDSIEFEIASYLNEVQKGEISAATNLRIKSIYKIIGEMESLGDSGEAIGRMLRRTFAHGKSFDATMLRKLNRMLDLVEEAYKAMIFNLKTGYKDLKDISNASDAEYNINGYRNSLREEHILNIEKENYQYQTGVFYMDIVNELERIGDFIINVSEALIGENEDWD
ncbi:MAG: Na/Pi cotransporter family protein [Bacteroidia bacterium]|nr:Na/Pi cotransporter family protein [Bacteroidia bacterium]